MSIKLMALVWRVDRADLSATDRLVLLRLCDFAADDGSRVYPAVETITDDCSLTRRAVQGAMGRLRESGLLVIVAGGRGGRKVTTRYRINVDRLTELANRARGARYSGDEGEQDDDETAHVVPETAHVVRKNRARGAPDPSLNHQGNIKDPPSALRASAPQGASARTRRGRLPDDFNLTPERAQAAAEAIERKHERTPSPTWLAHKFEEFTWHYQSECGPRALQADWNRAWVRYAVKAVELAPRHILQAELTPVAPPRAHAAAATEDSVPINCTDYAAMFPLSDLKEKAQ